MAVAAVAVAVALRTGWVVLVGLLEGVHGHFSPRGQEGHAATQSGVHRQVVVVVQATPSLDDGQSLVPWIEHHLGVAAELGTCTHEAAMSVHYVQGCLKYFIIL